MKTKIFNLIVVTLFLSLAVLLAVSAVGCADSKQLTADAQQIAADARQELVTLKQQATTLPADSPDRKLIEANAAKVEAVIAKADAVIQAAQSGDVSALAAAAAQTGVPYAGLAVLLAGFVWREAKAYQDRQQLATTRNALEQVVQSVDSALPAKSPEQKAAFNATQDSETQKLVADIRIGG